MKKQKKKLHFKKILLLCACIYVCFIFISQEEELYKYRKQTKSYEAKIEEEKAVTEELIAEKANSESDDFVEQIARKKLRNVLSE